MDISIVTKVDEKPTLGLCIAFPVNGNEYGNINTETYGFDPHSSSFQRLIREANYKGIKLPKACKKVIKKNKHLWDLKSWEHLDSWEMTKDIADSITTDGRTVKRNLEDLMVVGALNRKRGESDGRKVKESLRA